MPKIWSSDASERVVAALEVWAVAAVLRGDLLAVGRVDADHPQQRQQRGRPRGVTVCGSIDRNSEPVRGFGPVGFLPFFAGVPSSSSGGGGSTSVTYGP